MRPRSPAGTRRNNNVIITSKRRRDLMMTLSLRRVPTWSFSRFDNTKTHGYNGPAQGLI